MTLAELTIRSWWQRDARVSDPVIRLKERLRGCLDPPVRQAWISDIRSRERDLAAGRDAKLADEFSALASRWQSAEPDRVERHPGRASLRTDPLITHAAALACVAISRRSGIVLRDSQLHAALVIAAGGVAEMQTGEGKTFACFPAAVMLSLTGRSIHVACPNDYLAGRDARTMTPPLELLGLSVGKVGDQDDRRDKIIAYRRDVTYAAGHTLGFDHLRDGLLDRSQRTRRYADRRWENVSTDQGWSDPSSSPLQRAGAIAIVDEADNVLLDDAISPLVLSAVVDDRSGDAALHVGARELAMGLVRGTDFVIDNGSGAVTCTQSGFARIYAGQRPQSEVAMRPWHEYVIAALRAAHVLRRDTDYIIHDDQIRIVDRSTGRVFVDRTWSDGLHQAVQAKERLPITPQTTSLAQTTRQAFFGGYRLLGGMTGTAIGCEAELAEIYGLPVVTIDLHRPCGRIIHQDHLSPDQDAKWSAIAAETATLVSQNRAVLIGTQSIQVSRTVATKLRHSGLQPRVLNGVQDADEAAVISAAGRPGAVTVATNLAGRGTDIRLYGVTAAAGGLHVIVAGCHPLARVDRQLIGRAARGGDPGSARFFIAADDDLIRGHAGWLQRVIARELADGTYATLPLSDHIVPPSSTRRHLMDVQESLHRVQTGQRRDRWLQSHRDARWQQDPVDRSIHVNLCGVS